MNLRSLPAFLAAALLALGLVAPRPARAEAPAAPTQAFYHGTAYYPELWPEANIDRDIAQMKALGINLVRMGEFAWAKMEPNQGEISLDFFIRVMDRLNAAGIKTVFCTPTATPPIWLTDGHPERCLVNQAGETMIHGARQHASYDNPEVQAACLKIVQAIAEKIGRHPGLVGWQIDNELKCHVGDDYSASSVQRWHGWLAARYGTVDRLNAAWGADIWSERYQRFDQVPTPRATPFTHNASLVTMFSTFSRETIAEFLDSQCEVIRRFSGAPITHNMNLNFGINVERLSRNLDFVSFDNYSVAANYRKLVLDCDFFRAVKPGRPFWLMETSTAHNGWLKDYNPIHPPGYLAAELMSCYGLGAETVSYWLWQEQRTGCELPHSAILSAWGKPEIGYPEVQQVEAARQELAAFITGTRPAPVEAAITWSDTSRIMFLTEPIGQNATYKLNYTDTIIGWHRLLLDAGIPRDIRVEGVPLAGLKLLITPSMLCLSEAYLKKVEAWVRDGGVWICGPLTGMRTPEHTVPTDAALGAALENFAGIETVYSFPVTGTNATGSAFGLSAPLSGWCNAFRPVDASTEVIGKIEGEHAAGLAFITKHNVGKGAVVMLAAQPQGEAGEKLLSVLIAHAATKAGVHQRYASTVGTIVCPRIDANGRSSWLVVNLDGAGGTVQLPAAGTDAVSGAALPAGPLAVGPYQHRALRF